MWEPFTERARHAIGLAQEEAQRLGNNYIGAEHILLGILGESESAGAKVLASLGVDLAKTRTEVEAIVGHGGQTVQREMVFTPRAKRVIELAFEEARQLNHNYIGTEHLLLGVIRDGEGVCAQVLTKFGIDAAKVRAQTKTQLESEPSEAIPGRRQSATELYSMVESTRSPDAALTPAARHALVAATEAAQRCGSPVCTIEHLLFGIAHVAAAHASHLLAERGATAAAIEERLASGHGPAAIDEGEIVLDPRARARITKAIGDARAAGRRKANPEHLLLAMVRGDENDGAILLQTLGVDVAGLALALEAHLKGGS